MVDLLAFRGIRYAPQFSIGSVYAPPYDVISPALRQALIDQNPHNAVRVTLGKPGEPWHGQAAETFGQWLDDGVLIQDQEPSLYGYRQTFELDGETRIRTGFLARMRLAQWGDGIYRHERTRLGPKEDRLALLKTMQTNMSPIFGLYEDAAHTLNPLIAEGEPLFSGSDHEGVGQELWRITDPQVLRRITVEFERHNVAIADGHHRYETALNYQAYCRQRDGDPKEPQPYDYVLIYLTTINDPGMCVLPTHRVIAGEPISDRAALLAELEHDFRVSEIADDVPLSAAISHPPSVTIGLYLGCGGSLKLELRPDCAALPSIDDDADPLLAQLDVHVLQHRVLTHLGLDVDTMATTDRVTYTISESEARQQVDDGSAQAACIINATTLEQIWTASLVGLPMPQKSTYFYPKLLTGLVFNPLT